MLKNNQKDQRFKTVLRRMWYLIVTEFISAAPKGKKIKKTSLPEIIYWGKIEILWGVEKKSLKWDVFLDIGGNISRFLSM